MNKNQSIGMYVILGIMVLAFISMLFSGPTSSTEELSYTAFLQKVENKEIKSVDMGKDALIALPVKQPEAKKTNSNPLYGEVRPPKLQYKVVLPENSDVLSKLEQNDVEISAKRANESNSAFGMGSSLITILLVLGFIMLIIKSIQAGGAQAIAAMAYGTESIPKVDKICGPGNIYVALAKKAVFGYVSIDSVAGPSEILVIADETANPRYVAADLLSQAEHDEMASAILITTSSELANKVSAEIDGFLKELSRSEIISKSLDNYGYILLVDDINEAVSVANDIASEHLEIVTKDPFNVMTKIKNAGAIFLGEYSSEPLGDYFAGPNHVLPTNGTAKFFSALSVDDFIKKSSIISYSREALEAIHNDIENFASAEHLTAHANSIKVRFE